MESNRISLYGFNGYQVPATPRGPRSARRRRLIVKKVEDHNMRAFDLLATVAGELLLEKDVVPSSHNSSADKDQLSVDEAVADKECQCQDKCKPLELNLSTHEKCAKSFVVSELLSLARDQDNSSMFKAKLDAVNSATEVGLGVDGRSNSYQEDEGKVQNKDAPLNDGRLARMSDTELFNIGGPVKCFSNNRKVVSRDDDDNLSGCTRLSTMKKKKKKSFASVLRIGDRRIRKILASKHWNASKLKDERFHISGGDLKIAYCYRYQRSQRKYPFKKRFFDLNCVNNFGGRGGRLAPQKGIDGDVSEHGLLPMEASQLSSYRKRDSHVKLKIKSFRVPELFIEVAETTTVGSLKRTVMEALSAMLSGGVHVGVLFRGKKVRDDSKTLLQSGISHNNQPNGLGFTLEPNSYIAPVESPGLSQASLPSELPYPHAGSEADSVAHRGAVMPVTEPHGANSGKLVENDYHHGSASPITVPTDDYSVNSRALVAVPTEISAEALPLVPVQQKHENSEIFQRRVRRPFSVAEVEALVQAVEELGTGRWRDVKIRAFDDAKHRTYVDLKDKWKTLVHTAKLSFQQRRGEPVPQDLLDRVLAAHAYWSGPQHNQASNA